MPFFTSYSYIKDNTAAASKKVSFTSNYNHKATAATLINTTGTTERFTGNVVNKQTAIQEFFI